MTMDRPISFVAPMIRALWDDRKTQTRRVLTIPDWLKDKTPTGGWCHYYGDHRIGAKFHGSTGVAKIPFAVGDRLWVREDWKTDSAADAIPPRDLEPMQTNIVYMAGGGTKVGPGGMHKGRRRWSNHMPRWASRMTLTVTDVRVQRVREISYEDCVAESAWCETCTAMGQSACHVRGCPAAKVAFKSLWDGLNKERGHGWEVNPWVAAYTFTVEKRNIDAWRT